MTASTTIGFSTVASVVSTQATYSDVGTVFNPGSIVSAGTRIGYVVMKPDNWQGTITLNTTNFVARHFNGGTYEVVSTVPWPVDTPVVMTMSTQP